MPPDPPAVPNLEEEHLRQLSVAHFIFAGLQLFSMIFGLTFFGIALTMIAKPDWFQGTEPPAILMSGFYMTIGLILSFLLSVCAYCTFRAGRSLKEHRNYTFCKWMARFNCVFPPLGVLLGVFTLIVLRRPKVKALFGRI